MKALIIKNELLWNPELSRKLGEKFAISDSSNNLLIFADNRRERDIQKVIGQASKDSYQIVDLVESVDEECDFMADSGTCYRKLH